MSDYSAGGETVSIPATSGALKIWDHSDLVRGMALLAPT